MPFPIRASVAALLLSPIFAQNERPPEAFQVALGLQQRGLHDEATQYFQQFVQSEPKHPMVPEAKYRLAISRLELGQKDPAKKALQEALAAGGDGFRLRAECRYRLGGLLEAAGDHRGACEQFGALGKEVPADHYLLAPARYAEGEAWRELGDDEKAAAAFAAAVAAATGEQATFQFPALYQLGFAQLRRNEAAAAETFARAAAVAGDAAGKGECLYLCGDQLLRHGDHERAVRAFEQAKKHASEFADDAVLGLGFAALARGDQVACRAAFTELLEAFPQSALVPKAKLEIGRSLYGEGKHADAERMLQPLLEGDVEAPIRQQARELVGLCALATGAGEAAVATLQKARADAPAADQPRLAFALGEALANLGRWAEALEAYEAVPPDAPSDLRGEALYGACFALHSLGRHDESIVRAEAVRAIAPPHRLRDQATFAIAENQFACKRYEKAQREYAALAGNTAYEERAAWKVCWCRYLLGDKAAAASLFAAIADRKESSFAGEALAMHALSLLESGKADEALAAADRYRLKHENGAFLDRTERIAARVLRQKGDLAAAQKRLERAAAAASAAGAEVEARNDRLEQAELAYQQGDFRSADALFEGLAAQQDAAGARATAGRAWCAFELGDDAACATWLGKAKAHPAAEGELAGVLELESALAHRQKEWPAAIAAAKAFLQRFPQHGKATAIRYALGVAEARGGDAKAATKTLAALQKDAGYERMDRVHYELAWACRRGGDEAGALAAFALVAKESQDVELTGEARLHLGVAALEKKDLAAARTQLAAVAGSHRGTALYRLAFAEFEGADRPVKDSGATDKGATDRGAADRTKQQLAAARDMLAEVAAIPGEALQGEALYLGAECCQRLGDPRGAAERAQALLQKEPKHPRADRARLLLGECAVVLGDGATAVPALEEFVRNAGANAGADAGADVGKAHLWLGRARMLRSEHDKAEASLRRVTELSEGPLAAEAQFRIGESRMQRGDLPSAVDAFLKLPILYAHAEWVRRGLLQAALAYEKLQQTEKAQKLFRELVQQHPDSDEAKTASQHLTQR